MLALFVAVPDDDDDDDEVSLLDSCRHSLGASLLQSVLLWILADTACVLSAITFLWLDFLCSSRCELCLPGLPSVGIHTKWHQVLPGEQSLCAPSWAW